MKGGRNGGDKAKEGNIKLLRKKEQLNLKERHQTDIQRPKFGACCVCNAWIHCIRDMLVKKQRDLLVVHLQSLNLHLPFFLHFSSVMQRLSLQRLFGMLALCEVLPVGGTRRRRKVGSRANGLPPFCYFCNITPASISTWRTSLIMLTHKYDQQLDNDLPLEVAQSCPTLCDPMNRSTPGLPVHHQPGVHLNSRPLSQ